MDMMEYIVIAFALGSVLLIATSLRAIKPPKTRFSVDTVCPDLGTEALVGIEANGGFRVVGCSSHLWLVKGGCRESCMRDPLMKEKSERIHMDTVKRMGPERL